MSALRAVQPSCSAAQILWLHHRREENTISSAPSLRNGPMPVCRRSSKSNLTIIWVYRMILAGILDISIFFILFIYICPISLIDDQSKIIKVLYCSTLWSHKREVFLLHPTLMPDVYFMCLELCDQKHWSGCYIYLPHTNKIYCPGRNT